MPNDISVIIVDDSESDAMLLERTLRKEWPDVMCQWVDNAEALKQALESQTWSIVFSDYRMPKLEVFEALRIVLEADPLLPTIIVSGVLSTEDAVVLLKSGAHDFVSKNDLARLAPAMRRELEEALVRRQRNKAEEAFLESEERYRYITDAAPDAIVAIDLKRNIVAWNSAARELFGYAEDEVLGQDFLMLIPERDQRKYRASLDEMCAEDDLSLLHEMISMTGEKKDQSEFPCELSLSCWRSSKGKYCTAIIRDVSERMASESALRESEERFRAMAESATDAVIMMGHEGQVTYWNQAAEKIFGYSSDEILNHNLHALISDGEERTRFESNFQKFLCTGKGHIVGRTVECLGLRKNGDTFPVELSVGAVQLGGRWNATGIVRDISERKINDERLRQSEKMDAMGNLAGGIAHDLKNMMFPILTLTEMTLKDLPEGSHARERLEKVIGAAERAKTLVENIHAYSHKEDADWGEVDLQDLASESLDILRPTLPSSINIVTDFEKKPCIIKADGARLETVIINLATNAADAIQGKVGTLGMVIGNVVLTEENLSNMLAADVSEGAYVKLTVFDTGTGMSEDVLQHIFAPYYSTKEKGQGTGLGLALVQKIIIEHHGAIEVSSQPGVGTAFDIYLPTIHEGST